MLRFYGSMESSLEALLEYADVAQVFVTGSTRTGYEAPRSDLCGRIYALKGK